MLDDIKKILKFHKKSNPGVTVVKVTTTRYYEIREGSSEKPEYLMEEWFKKYSPFRSHAYRDGSLLVEHFNDDAEIVTIDEQDKPLVQ